LVKGRARGRILEEDVVVRAGAPLLGGITVDLGSIIGSNV